MYVCTYCHAPGDTPRCGNCGAPAERIAQPVVARRDARRQPLINEPWTDEEIADAHEAVRGPYVAQEKATAAAIIPRHEAIVARGGPPHSPTRR
jgi:hypothetical protein